MIIMQKKTQTTKTTSYVPSFCSCTNRLTRVQSVSSEEGIKCNTCKKLLRGNIPDAVKKKRKMDEIYDDDWDCVEIKTTETETIIAAKAKKIKVFIDI
jgi:hypothetical protein